MSIPKMSNYKSTIKSSTTSATTPSSSSSSSCRSAAARTMTRASNSAAFTKFLLINLLILCQSLFLNAYATAQQQHKPQQHHKTPHIFSDDTLSMLTATSPLLSVPYNSDSDEYGEISVTSAESAVNEGMPADARAAADDDDGDDDYDGNDHDHGDNLAINQIITNLTLLQDATHEYDATTVSVLGNVTHSCLQKCIEEETWFLNDFGVKCSVGDNRTECYRSRCFKGCELWLNALKEFEPCQEACSSAEFYPFDLPCISACEQAQRRYWHLQRLRVAQVVTGLQPQLLHDNDSTNTLTLKWPISVELLPAQYLASRPFNIQYQYVLRGSTAAAIANDTPDDNQRPEEELAAENDQEADMAKQWWNLADYNCNENFECDIMDGLMPYTSYRFRFELPFGENLEDVLYTTPSGIYTTPAMGSPISQPIIQQTVAIDATHIVIFWEAGKFTNGPLQNYKIQIQHKDSNFKMEKLLPPSYSYYIFAELSPSTTYTIHLSMINQEDEGPTVESYVTTKDFMASSLKLDDFSSLLMAGEYSIVLKSLDPLIETTALLKSEEILVDFDFHQYTKQIFVVDITGHVFSFSIDQSSDYASLKLPENFSDFQPSKLSLDWLNQKLYLAGETAAETWQILRTDFKGSAFEVIVNHLPHPVLQLQVDPINGWLFVASIGSFYQVNLASMAVESILTPFKITHFVNDFQHYLIKTYDSQDRSIHELSYDGLYSQKLSSLVNPQLQGDILSFTLLENQLLLACNGSHLLREKNASNELELLPIRDVELCWKVIALMPTQLANVVQPVPRPLAEPQSLHAVLSDTKAIITWQPPNTMQQFQSLMSWQKWEYELEILDVSSNSAFNIRSVKTTYFEVERLQANNLYKIKVRALFAGAMRSSSNVEPSEWSQELIIRTWPMGNHRLLWSSSRGLYETDELAEEVEFKALEAENVGTFVQVNTSLFYVTKDSRRLKCLNLMNPEVSCGFQAANVYSFDYDWRGGKLYWSDLHRNCIIRADLKGDNKELLPIFGARYITLDSLRGYIYYTTDSRLVRRHLSGALFGQETEYYHTNGNGQSVRGFALDLLANHIYWFVQHQEENAKLLRSDLDEPKTEDMLALPSDEEVSLDSLQYLKEVDGLIWLNSNNTKAVLMRKEQLTQYSLIQSPSQVPIGAVKLRSDFVPYMDYSVVPEAVDRESIQITEGYWDDFNVKWSAINNPHNFSVFYKVLITSSDAGQHQVLSFEVSQPVVRITEFKMASHNVNVTITPLTLWSHGPSTRIQLRTPSAAPKQPKNLRVFVEQLQEPLQNEANITALVRWDSPDNISSEKEVFYKVYCWLKDELHSVKDIDDMGVRSHEVRFYNLKKEESYTFQVQAFSLSRSKGGEKTSLLTHFINPEVQSRPKLIFTTAEFIGELDLDLNMTKVWVHTSSEVEHLVLMPGEQRLIWVNENVELLTYQPGFSSLKLARMRAEVLSLCVDWIQRKVYWAEVSGDIDHSVDIYELDLNQYEGKVMMGSRLFPLSQGKLLKNLVVLPYARSLLWLEYEMGSRNATLQGRNLTDMSPLKFKNLPPLKTMFDGSWHPDMESVNVMDFKGKLYAYEIQRQLLTNMKIPLSAADQFRSLERDAGFIYALTNRSIKAFNRRKHNLEYSLNLPEVRLIKAFNFQEYPQRHCLLPDNESTLNEWENLAEHFVKDVGESFVVLQLTASSPFGTCRLPIPGLKYKVSINDDKQYEQNFRPELGLFNVTDLKPFTNYSIAIAASSYYQTKLMLPEMIFTEFSVITTEGVPSRPQNFTVQAVSPTELLVLWQEPENVNAEKISYQLYWQLSNSSLSSRKLVEGFEVNLINLEPNQDYTVWLEVFSSPSKLNQTDKVNVTTYPQPEHIKLVDKQAYNLTMRWFPNVLYDSVILECLPHTQNPDVTPFSIDITGIDSNITVVNLEPKTKYEFYLKLNYPSVAREYVWPEQQAAHYTFETLGDAPGRPSQPQIEHITGEIFKVFWQPADDNGAAIVEYSLEALQARIHKRIRREAPSDTPSGGNHSSSISMLSQMPWVEELQPLEDKWVVYCNTSELSCIVRELHTMRLLMFRVRARNEPYGWGPYSEDSERVLEPFVSPQKRNSLVLAIIAPAAIVTTCVILLIVVRKVHKRRLKAKQLLAKSRPSIWSNVSSMQQMASRNRAFSVNSSSTMYTGGPLSDADIALLPHINWSQISLLNFLGSGAFGEVYEGLMKHEDQDEEEKVAIKSLRKGASEFAELLQEAQLMSNFKHENIVRLIGVCCETESISIIMEHMEGGDLLSYLRESRPNSTRPMASLQLLDLMSMCIDVATGMAYLEDMHFVHRDLACRNCLVSSRTPSKRTVKIGDFGLARDIYKSDYYRKEGEALMPVRWMAPESLVDGVFTTQSDVWAFGVLCWEILTLGQQPYAGRNNFEVLNYVKEGGRLEQPDNCPDKFFALMTDCWHTDPEERLSFRKIFNTLLVIKTDVRRVSLGDYALYANQYGTVLSSFLAQPLNKVDEKDEDQAAATEEPTYECKQNLRNEEEIKLNAATDRDSVRSEKLDMKVRFENDVSAKSLESDSLNDESHLIDAKLYRIQENPDYYINEGVSRL